ncbi:MAG: hypothetical protein EBY20_04825 [Alphaproteobacteria bacterium]|nr:hypothetical protein [Alphaproteobacteria bacterium]
MNHLTAWAITITAFSSGLYSIYKFIRAKYVSYDTNPIHYWSNRKQRTKKRYKTFKANRRNRNTKISNLNNRNKSQLSYAKYGKLNKLNVSK